MRKSAEMGRTHQLRGTGNGSTREEGGQSIQRHAVKYQQWQNFKSQRRDSEHLILQKKIDLQHELIQANDKLHHKLQEEDDHRRKQLRDAKKKEKAMKEERLMDTCRQSLASEREQRLSNRSKRDTDSKNPKPIQASRHKNSDIHLPTIESREPTILDTYEDLHGHMDVEDGTIEEEDEYSGDEDFEDKEEHEYQLQKMFGKREANYFLRPRIEPEKKKKIRIPPAVRKKGGRAGATTLWTILREKTNVKLQKADAQIPAELKDAYGAFVRECLTKNKMVAKRSFYSGNGVPETEKIQDGSYRKKVHELRHHVELMYRSAHTNQDKTAILTYNNPLPDFSDRNGEEGPMRYYPSWIEEEEEVVDAPAYQKWLEKLPDIDSLVPMETDETETKPTAGDGMDSLPIKDHLPASTSKKSTKLSFLTEDDATCEGKFWASRPEKRDDGNEQEMILLSKRTSTFQNKPTTRKRTSQGKQNERRSLTAPSLTRSSRQQKLDASWQPLSLTALTEYKPTVDTSMGAGDFAYGSTNMWKPILADDS